MTSEVLPDYFRLHEPLMYDNSVIKTNIFEIFPVNGVAQTNLNQNGFNIRFIYNGVNSFIRLNSPRIGFRVRCGFITRTNANAHDANTTLASNYFGHLFQRMKFSIAGRTIEQFNNPGVLLDVLQQTKNQSYRDKDGEISHFIPDEKSGLANNIPITATVADSTHLTSAVNIDFNPGYDRRRQLFNYTVAGNDIVRNVECFIPLSDIFGFAEGFTKLLKFIGFEIELTRKAAGEYQDCVFGAANTDI